MQTHVIVGAGLAGAKAAQTLREEGFDGRVVLVGSESDRPYERPPLSKDYLRGESGRDAAYAHEAGYYDEHDIELRTETTVARVDLGAKEVELEGGERIGYDRLLLTPGASRGACRSLGPTSTACSTCACSATRTRSASASRPAATRSSSARAGSVPRSPPRPARRASTSR